MITSAIRRAGAINHFEWGGQSWPQPAFQPAVPAGKRVRSLKGCPTGMIMRFFTSLLFAAAPALVGQSIAGRWDATVEVNSLQIPFRLEIAGDAAKLTGFFFNGEERDPSTSGHFESGSLVLRWDDYAGKLEASLRDGQLDGKYERDSSSGHLSYAFHAKRYSPPSSNSTAPSIGGLWIIPTNSAKGEGAWRFIVRQSGAEVSAAILRVDGDTGALTGSYKDGKFVLSHFSGARPALLEITPAADGSLDILQNGKNKLTAVRSEEARAKGLPEPEDPRKHTSVRDPAEAFAFSYPDLSGHTVSNTDARFQGKVLLVNITGSWCPNCHDEAPFLAELYRKYREQGLEIVALAFEEQDQLKDPARLRAFLKKYGIGYTVLLAGEPSEAKDKLSQAVNWNAFPTTFFIARDGRVRGVHTGFPSSASGELYVQAKEEFAAQVERLLHEDTRTSR